MALQKLVIVDQEGKRLALNTAGMGGEDLASVINNTLALEKETGAGARLVRQKGETGGLTMDLFFVGITLALFGFSMIFIGLCGKL